MSRTPVTMAESIDWLFTRLAGTYGTQWTRQWDGTPMTDVKTTWGYELSAYAGNPTAIRHALDNLPERCPNVIQFRNLCRSAPSRIIPQIEAPKADPERVAAELAKLDRVKADAPHGMKEWAHRLKALHEQGDRLNMYQISCYRTSLGMTAPEPEAA